jgi:hypothetical protein
MLVDESFHSTNYLAFKSVHHHFVLVTCVVSSGFRVASSVEMTEIAMVFKTIRLRLAAFGGLGRNRNASMHPVRARANPPIHAQEPWCVHTHTYTHHS